MKKHAKEAVIIALFALLILPVQQVLMKTTAAAIPAETKKAMPEEWSSNALSGNAGELMNMVFFHLQQRRFAEAETWLNFGSMTLQAPSVMLFYGDWLKQKGNPRRAEYFYRYALKKAKNARAPQRFILELEKRLEKK